MQRYNPDRPLEPPMLQILLPSLNKAEIAFLIGYAQQARESHPHFMPWLSRLLKEERNRRVANPPQEPCMMPIPPWNGEQLADAMMATFVLVRMPLSDAMARFLDDLHTHVMANAAAALQQFNPEVLI